MSPVADRLRELVDALPEGASVTLQRRTILSWLEESESSAREDGDRISDLTVQEVAEELARSPSCIRGWLSDGTLQGYKLKGREWRVSRDSLREFLAGQRRTDDQSDSRVPARRSGSLSDWRNQED